MKEYKIGEVAKLLGLTTQALRFYEQEGVINPRKSESGTRYYRLDEIHMLLSFKKYRMAEFNVQDIIEHIHSGSLHTISRQLDDKSEELIARSEELLRRAHALHQFRREVDEAAENLGILRESVRPEYYVQTLSFDELDELRPKEIREVQAYIDALPATSIGFVYDAKMYNTAKFHMCVSPENARYWQLPTDHAILMKSTKCVSTFIHFSNPIHHEQSVRNVLEEVRCKGHVIDCKESIFGWHIASEAHDGFPITCGKIYIPIE